MLSPFIVLDIVNPLTILIPMSPGKLKVKSAGMKAILRLLNAVLVTHTHTVDI